MKRPLLTWNMKADSLDFGDGVCKFLVIGSRGHHHFGRVGLTAGGSP